MFSARASRKFLTVGAWEPDCLVSSATMAFLSSAARVGAPRMPASLASRAMRPPRVDRALAVGSMVEDLAAAVY